MLYRLLFLTLVLLASGCGSSDDQSTMTTTKGEFSLLLDATVPPSSTDKNTANVSACLRYDGLNNEVTISHRDPLISIVVLEAGVKEQKNHSFQDKYEVTQLKRGECNIRNIQFQFIEGHHYTIQALALFSVDGQEYKLPAKISFP